MQADKRRAVLRDPATRVWQLIEYGEDGTETITDLGSRDIRVATRRFQSAVADTPPPAPIDDAAEPDPHRTQEVDGSVAWALAEHLERAAPDLADATRSAYKGQAGHVVRLLGGLPVAQLRRKHIDAYVERRTAEGVCAETRRKELMLMRAAIRRAVALGVTPGEAESLLFPKLKSVSVPRDRWLTFDDYQRVLQKLPPARQMQLLVACYTGARRVELMRMRWEHIDWVRLELVVHQSKPKKSRRIVPLPAELQGLLRQMRKPKGALLPSFNNFYRELDRAAAKVGVAHFTLNDCRRTFASWMLQGGVPLYDVSKLLGHRSIAMVQKVYGHLSDDSLRRAVAVLPSSKPSVVER